MTSSCCKVGEMINRYQIRPPDKSDSVDNYLVARWCGLGDMQKTGLRPLTDWFNKRVLKSVYSRQKRHYIDTHVDSDYNLLHSTSKEQRSDHQVLLTDLRQDGIDGEAVSNDFISTTTLYRHLINCISATKEREKSDTDWEMNQISYIYDFANSNFKNVLTSLDNKERITGAADVDTNTTLYLKCPQCSREVSFERAIDLGYVCQDHLPMGVGEQLEHTQSQDEQPSSTPTQSTLSQTSTNTE